jgi:SAM-dependent methyltransferase
LKWATYEPARHLSESETYPAVSECPICGYTGPRQSRAPIQKQPRVDLLLCGRCSGLSASQMPTQGVLDRMYASYYAERDQERVIFQNPSRLARHIISMIDIGSDRGEIRIIDFGGGDGAVSLRIGQSMAAATHRTVRVEVVDYVTEMPRRSGDVEVAFVRDLIHVHSSCDLIVASAVFEHVPGLGAILPALAQKLKPGGYLYARTAYNLPLMLVFGLHMPYPAHVHDLGDAFWGNLPNWFPLPVKLVYSRPGMVEADLRQDFLRAAASWCLKLPAQIECLWTRHPIFKFYGGWEVLLQRD